MARSSARLLASGLGLDADVETWILVLTECVPEMASTLNIEMN